MAFLLELSLSVLIMPVINSVKEKTMLPMYIDGVLFWIGLMGTIVISIKIERAKRSSSDFMKSCPDCKQLGLIHFFQNKAAVIIDILLFVSIVCFTVIKITNDNYFVQFVCISLFIFSFGMHCMLNGSSYKYINY